MDNAAAPAYKANLAATLCMGCMAPATGAPFCPACGWQKGAGAGSVLHLPPGTLLHDCYLVGRVLGQGGFGITYMGWDTQLQRKVAIKEYFPQVIASRLPGGSTVAPTGARVQSDFEHGLEGFMNEGRILARFADHPCIVSVLNLFEGNRTGYLVMGYLDGVTLSQSLTAAGGKLAYDTAREIMIRVLDGLREVHGQGLLHRDISPDNIYLTRQGPVKILDFGAARMAVGERSQSLSVVLKEGYAPEEQYRRNGNQGPWTDIYATAATFYRAIAGVTPPPALDRLADDRLVRPSAYCPNLPGESETAILKGMAIRAASRYQSVEQFQHDLMGRIIADPPFPPGPGDGKPPESGGSADRKTKPRWIAIGIGGACVALLLVGWMARSLLYSHYETAGEASYRSGDYEMAKSYFEKAADGGNAASEMNLGRLYARGEGATADYGQARQWYEKAAAAGNSEAMDNLGFLYDNGLGVSQDYAQALKWYREAAAAGNADAMVRLGILYHDGSGVAQDYDQTRQWYEKAAARGSTRGMTNLGLMYEGGLGVSRDYGHARQLYEKAAAAGSPAGMTLLGVLYDNGHGVTKDVDQARHWYEKAAAAGDPRSMTYLGDIYGTGRGVTRDFAQQRAWYDKAAGTVIPRAVDANMNERYIASGRASAMLIVGDIYRSGQNSTPDYEQARLWYEKAAADGNAEAMARIGQMYLLGQGIDRNYEQARQWYEKSAAGGSSDAMNDLGVLYFNGEAVTQSYERARQWYEKSAAVGNATAMKNLGQMYDLGNGVAVDKAQSIQWYEKAANAGNTDSMVIVAERILQDSDVSHVAPLEKLELLQKLEQARQWIEKAADAGNLKAKVLLPTVNAIIQGVQSHQ